MTSQIQEEHVHMEEEENPQEEEEEVVPMKRVNILVAVDESKESIHACEWACKNLLASHTNIRQNYKFILLHVKSPVCASSGPAYIMSNHVLHLMESAEAKTTEKVLKRALDVCKRYNVKAETRVVTGNAKERICEAAKKLGAHFIVVGTHGYGPFMRAIKGSDVTMVQANDFPSDKQEVNVEIKKTAGNEVWERIHALEERMRLLTKFTVKVTHAAATTLHLLKDMEGDLPKKDSKMLFDFLTEDWANILLGRKEAKKP